MPHGRHKEFILFQPEQSVPDEPVVPISETNPAHYRQGGLETIDIIEGKLTPRDSGGS